MKIWFQKHTIIGRNPWLDEAYEQHAAAILPPGVQVDFHSLPPEVYEGTLPADYVRFGQLEVLFSWYFADQAVEAERAGYSAFVIGTSQDPGLDMARSLVSIPVVGDGETVFDLLTSQGLRFGVVGFIPALEEILTDNLIRNGWHRHCVGFDYIPEGRVQVERAMRDGDIAGLRPAMELAAERLRLAGAQVIVPGEGLPNEALWAGGIRTLAGLPFIDANGLTIARAEMLARTRELGCWGADRDSYRTRRAPAEELERLRGLFSPAIAVRQQNGKTE